jgi:hypothetical protein
MVNATMPDGTIMTEEGSAITKVFLRLLAIFLGEKLCIIHAWPY